MSIHFQHAVLTLGNAFAACSHLHGLSLQALSYVFVAKMPTVAKAAWLRAGSASLATSVCHVKQEEWERWSAGITDAAIVSKSPSRCDSSSAGASSIASGVVSKQHYIRSVLSVCVHEPTNQSTIATVPGLLRFCTTWQVTHAIVYPVKHVGQQ